jgi:RNA polymerase sigma-70 factor, ECF subfamily
MSHRPPDDEGRLAPDPDVLIARHLAMARRIAAGYRGRRLSDEDLAAEADLALVEAAHAYDLAEHPGVGFATFAATRIRTHLRAALYRAPIVAGPRAMERAAMKGEAVGPRPHDVGVDELGMMPPDPDKAALAGLVEQALDRCGETGRNVLLMVAVDGLSIRQAARRLGITERAAGVECEAARATVAGEFRRRGIDEAKWAAMISA